MKRSSLIAMLLLGGTLNAHADNDVMKTSQDIRAAMTGCRSTPIIARGCLARREACRRTKAACPDGWRYSHMVREREGNASVQGVARRPPCMKTPGGWNDQGRRAPNPCCGEKPLEHAEYDGADKGDCQIRGHDTQAAGERTQKAHFGKSPWFRSLPANAENSKRFRPDKVSPAVLSRNLRAGRRQRG